MSDEVLRFSMQDLGRLAAVIGDLGGVVDWVLMHASTGDEGRAAVAEVLEGYSEERIG